jgi:hypothetical protein
MLALISASQAMFPWMKPMQESGPQLDFTPFVRMGGVVGLLGILIPVYFLITRKQAFVTKKQA